MKQGETITVKKTESPTLTADEIGGCCGVLTVVFFAGVGTGACLIGCLVFLLWQLLG
jgi:hypothetical protein